MSTFEQKIEPHDDKYQFLLFAADPYETIGFKIPNLEIDGSNDGFYYFWDDERKVYTLQVSFIE